MPTFNQLVRHGRKQVAYKSTAPALQRGLNTLENKATNLPSPRSAVFALLSVLPAPRSLTLHCVRSLVYA